ncbi:hypothetical protein HU200_035814 [Digitaria exilis]|uniref:Uncharacterized protein n=1 Tax=Digitaria exilis TaxID=1010633 RepID=A0A835BHT5_9POAL|nr:hypothetical protein HU200_035814 [Digitaria exilis]CAB3466978.1 unnamed protein product [Digitaria exilis]
MASSATTALAFLILTGSSITAIHRSQYDAATTAFVAASYACLVLLFCFLRRFEAAPPGSPARGRARAGVWLATAALTAMFSWRVAALVPWHVAAGVWLLGGSTVVGGFYALFLVGPARGDEE